MRRHAAVLALSAMALAGAAIAQQRPAARGAARLAPASDSVARPDTAVIMLREVFEYDAAGRRDPFVPLLDTDELRPALEELRLTGVLVHPVRPVAVMRDADGTQYRVTTGMTVGRMRVVAIRPRTVVFAFTEYGTNRRDSLVLGDTAQVRP